MSKSPLKRPPAFHHPRHCLFEPSIDFTWTIWRRQRSQEISPDMHTAIMLGANRSSTSLRLQLRRLHFHLHDTSRQTNKQTNSQTIIIIIIKGPGRKKAGVVRKSRNAYLFAKSISRVESGAGTPFIAKRHRKASDMHA